MKAFIKRLLDLTVQIQQIPAPSFAEVQRAQFVKELFETAGLHDVSMDTVSNVYARLPGEGDGKPLVVSAHLDTVFPRETDLTVLRKKGRVNGPGIGDNSLGVAALFGLVWLLRERAQALPGDLWLVANVCEEGLGDLRGMRAVVDRFGGDVRAYLVIEGLSLGYVQHRALGVQRYRVTAKTAGGHSWSDYGQPSAIHELSKLVTQLTTLPMPAEPRTTINVGRMGGGTSINAIASEAWLELDLRSESVHVLTKMTEAVEQLIDTASRPEALIEAEVIGRRPAGELPANHPLVRLAENCLREQGIEPKLMIGSTDANVPLNRGLPAVVLGVTNGAGAHTTSEFIYTEPVTRGMQQLVQFVSKVWSVE
ncbi:MAG: M20/M25/M40 family metallo-hydrolase [Anaerolineales bacterium]|nr:M20/M25/M40 family metallo-hydrolase [Anaerolineales bacterium]